MLGSHSGGRLSLDLSEETIALYEHTEQGTLELLGNARLDSPDFSAEIDALRIEALIRDPAKKPVTIWLPESQILSRSYALSSRNSRATHSEALRILQSETGYSAEELAIDLVQGPAGQPMIVLAALCQTVREAIEYTHRWGFKPGKVSTRVKAESFLTREPVFTLPTTRAANAGRRIAQVAAVSVIALGCGFAGLKLLEVSQPVLHAITVKTVPGHQAGYVENRDQTPNLTRTSTTASRSSSLQSMPIRSLGVSDHDRLKLAGIARYGQSGRKVDPAQLVAPSEPGAMLIGAESSHPPHVRPGRLAAVTQTLEANRVPVLRTAIDRIRINSRALAQASGTVQQRRVAVQSAVVAADLRRDDPAATTLLLSSVSEKPKPRERAAARAVRNAATQPSASLLPKQRGEPPIQQKPDTANTQPKNISVPPPRPADAVKATVRLQQNPGPEAPNPRISVREAAAVPQPSQVAQPEPVVPDPEEAYAALSSPRPLVRPETLRAPEVTLPKKTKSKPISVRASPTSVRVAALERGIELSETNLIGVIEASSGRRALVRLPDGDFRKVARGDELNGWRVSSIGREALRLTRKGQNRTLMLVSR